MIGGDFVRSVKKVKDNGSLLSDPDARLNILCELFSFGFGVEAKDGQREGGGEGATVGLGRLGGR